MHPYRMDPCPQGSHSRGISYFHGGPCPEGTRAGGSMGPWEYGDGAGGLTLHWVYTGVGARPATKLFHSFPLFLSMTNINLSIFTATFESFYSRNLSFFCKDI